MLCFDPQEADEFIVSVGVDGEYRRTREREWRDLFIWEFTDAVVDMHDVAGATERGCMRLPGLYNNLSWIQDFWWQTIFNSKASVITSGESSGAQ